MNKKVSYTHQYLSRTETYKKQHTRRFRKSETAFINTLFRVLRRYRGKLTVTIVARELHMSRQAFYLHHHDINTAITESEELLLAEFREFLAARCPKDGGQRNNRQLIAACFLFMSQRRVVFQEICMSMGTVLFDKSQPVSRPAVDSCRPFV